MKPRLVYVCCEGFSSPVIEPQAVRVIEQIHQRGRRFDFLLFGNLQTGWLSHRRNQACLERTRPRIPGETRFIYLADFGPQSTAYARWRMARWLGADLRGGRPVILHCRSEYASNIALPFRRRWPNVRMVNEILGEKLCEYDYRCERKPSPLLRAPRAWKRRRFAHWQAEGTHAADRVLCVSEALADYYRKSFPEDAGKVRVLRVGADETQFRFSAATRREMRESLGVQDRRVFAYNGSLAPYQMAVETLQAFRAFREIDPAAFLLLLTPQAEEARRLTESVGIGQRDVLVRSVPFEEVASHLMAADVGMLLRESLPINHYASPTKLAEYWLTGLPVLTTKGVSDAIGHIEGRPCMGVVMDPDAPETWPSVYATLQAGPFREPRREDVRREAAQHFSRSHFLEAYGALLDDLCGEIEAGLQPRRPEG
ncbi:MAG TPA: glycosyltransferase [Sumerlaeia bacterium]|nr:glycosyltransferase [Sumerlaeia bacterium]